MNIFPQLRPGKWIEVNLNVESKKVNLDLSSSSNQIKFVSELLKEKKADYLFGGFLEDRTYIWRNHPNEKANSLIHLGIDYTVPEETKISLPMKGEVLHIMNDPENKRGWGGRIIWRLENNLYLLYGHLKQNINLKVGQICNKGTIVGIIGDKNENGDWWPHLHAQIMNQSFIDHYKDCLEEIDGYLSKDDSDLKNVINPETIISIL